jgi:ribonuclease P protein component
MTVRLARLKTRADFLRVAGTRVSAGRPGLVLQAAPQLAAQSTLGETAGVGFTASRRVGNAVARNRAKRRLRAAAAAVIGEHGKPGADYVLIARADTGTRRYADLVSDLEGALRQVAQGRPRPARTAGGKG